MSANSSGIKHFFEPDDVFADYTILQFCGRGAYGEVYLAEDITHKTVALKVIPILSGSEIWRMELIGLRHYRQSIDNYKSLIEIYHVGETEDYFYYTMEAADNMLHGESDDYVADTLAHRLERGGRLSPEKVLELTFSMLDALEILADHDLAHRDLKPANIVFVNGQAKLSDIGLISNTGVRSKLVGTVDFLPPELADGDPVGYGNDLYALGKVIYCALTGLVPENFPEVPLTLPLPIWRQFKPVLLRACSTDPRQRFYTSREFRGALPAAIREANVLDNWTEALRLHRGRHPALWRGSIISIALILCGVLLGGYLSFQKRRFLKNEQRNRIDYIFSTIDNLNDQLTHLARLAESSGNQPRCRQLEIIAALAAEARTAGDWANTERYCRYADSSLRVWAEEEYRLLAEKYPVHPLPDAPAQLANLLSEYHDFSETPLVKYLTPASAEQLSDALQMLSNALAAVWKGPRPGRDWSFEDDPDLRFVYVARGRLAQEPSQSYWIGVNEVTRGSFQRLTGGTPPVNGTTLPMTRLSWNDRLDMARIMTERARAQGVLPPGFIYRLPYFDEWDFALRGGWRGTGNPDYEQQALNDVSWNGVNSRYHAHPVRTRHPGKLGVYDMIGNVAETVLTTRDPQSPRALRPGNFGASFRDRRVTDELTQPCDPELLGNAWSGVRLVLGCGSEDYFEQFWYTGSIHAVELPEIRYEMLGGPRSAWTGENAMLWSELLGGRLAVLSSPSRRTQLFTRAVRLREFACLVGAQRRGGHWEWLDGNPVYDGSWLQEFDKPSNDTANYLVWDHAFWRGTAAGETIPLLLVEWPRTLWQRREQLRKTGKLPIVDSPLILKRFSVSGKNLFLLRASVDWYTAKRLAELLGGVLAMPMTDAEQRTVLDELADFSELRIALGCYRRCGEWRWLNHEAGPRTLPADRGERNASLNSCFMAIYGRKFCNADSFDAFLCEVPPGPAPRLLSSAEKKQ